jgi:hypothetical protein
MANSKVNNHVDNFLSSIDPRGRILRIADTLAEASFHDIDVQESLKTFKTWIDKETEELSKRIPKPEPREGVLGSSEGMTVIATAYLRAVEVIRVNPSTGSSALAELKKQFKTLDKRLAKVEPEFTFKLLQETERRTFNDPLFSQKIENAKQDLQWLVSQVTLLRRELPLVLQEPQTAVNFKSISRLREEQWIALIVIAVGNLALLKTDGW